MHARVLATQRERSGAGVCCPTYYAMSWLPYGLLLALAALAACLPHEGMAFVNNSSSMIFKRQRRCLLLAGGDNLLTRCSNQHKMLGVASGREGAAGGLSRKTRRGRDFVRLGAAAAGRRAYETSFDGELPRVPSIKARMMEILRPDLPRVSMHGLGQKRCFLKEMYRKYSTATAVLFICVKCVHICSCLLCVPQPALDSSS